MHRNRRLPCQPLNLSPFIDVNRSWQLGIWHWKKLNKSELFFGSIFIALRVISRTNLPLKTERRSLALSATPLGRLGIRTGIRRGGAWMQRTDWKESYMPLLLLLDSNGVAIASTLEEMHLSSEQQLNSASTFSVYRNFPKLSWYKIQYNLFEITRCAEFLVECPWYHSLLVYYLVAA